MERAGAVVVIGGGPSLTPAQVEYCRGRARVVAIKEAARLAQWADVLYFGDRNWFDINREEVMRFQGAIATIGNEDLLGKVPRLTCYRNEGTDGLCEDPRGLRTGNNSGYQAVNLAFHMGAKTIVLLGIDMKARKGAMHWFHRAREHPELLYQKHMVPKFSTLIEPLARHGVRVVNCSPDSALECFEKRALEEALC